MPAPEPSEESLIATLLHKGLVTPRQLAECKRERAERAAAGERVSLTDVLVARGLLDPGAVAETMAEGAVPPAASSRVPQEVLAARADPKRVMGKYTLVQELGRGGMAVVHKAWDELLSHYVALKLILSQEAGLAGAPGDEHVQEFLREARTAVKMSHPNIVRVYELGRHGERHYLSMEYIAGHTLRALIEEGRDKRDTNFYSDPPRFIAMLVDVALALDYAHRLDPPVIHRDIKPHNILVDKRGKAFVVDFGLAKELRAEGRLTISGVVKGTPCYMSPEQVQGRPLDGRTDLYALGAVLYELLTGRPPFLGRNNHEIMNRVVGEEPVRPSVVVRGLHRPPAALEAICLKALEKDPARRYRSGRQFADDLQRYVTGKAVEARAAGPVDRAVRWMTRRKALSAAIAMATVMTVVAIVALVSRQPPETRPVVVEDPAAARLQQATRRIEEIASRMEFGQAAKAVEELMARLNEGSDKTLLRGRLEEIRAQEALLNGLAVRIQQAPRDYASFRLRDERLADVRLIDATKEQVVLRYAGRAVEVPWGKLAPEQHVAMVRDYWPALDGEALLGFGVLCLRQGLRDESERALLKLKGTPHEAQARRYLKELGRDFPVEAAAGPPVKPAGPPPADPKPVPPKPVKVAESAPAVDPALFSRYVAHRRDFAVALSARELDVAARALLRTARDERLASAAVVSALEAAATKIASAPGDAAVRRLFDAAEDWLARREEKNELELRCGFDARDLAAVALAHAEIDAAADRLAKAGAEVTLFVDGEMRTGVLRVSRGLLTLAEKIVQGGQAGEVGWAVAVRGGKGARLPMGSLLAILQADRAKRPVRPDRAVALGEALLQSYDAFPARSVGPAAAMRAVEASIAVAERGRMRVDEYFELQATLGAWPPDLLAMASQAEGHVKRGRARYAAGDAEDAASAFDQAQAAYDAMAKSLAASRREPATDEWRHAAMQAAYHGAMCRGARLDALWRSGRRHDAEMRRLFEEFARMLGDFFWEYEPYACSQDAMLVLAHAVARLALQSEPPEAHELWTGVFKMLGRLRATWNDPKLRSSETARVLGARTALTEARLLMAYAEGAGRRSGYARYGEAARVIEDFLKVFPAARAQEPELALELGRAWCKAGSVDRGLPLVEEASRDPRCVDAASDLLVEFARDPKVAHAAGDLMLERGGDRLYRAVAAFRRGLDADKARGWHGIGSAYYGLGRWFEAAVAFAEAERAGHPDAVVRRRMARRQCGEESGPKDAREEALEAADAARRAGWATPRRDTDSVAMMATSGPPLSERMPVKRPALDRVAWRKTVLSRGGSRETEEAVLAALVWLARHQSADGSWSATKFVDRCRFGGKCTPNPGRSDFDAGVTGLALLAFLGAGYTHHSDDAHEGIRFGDVVRRGLRWIVREQDPEGCMGPRSSQKYMLNHTLCATALAEAYGLTGSILLQDPAQRGIDFVIASQNPGKAWRYSFKCGDNDTLVTAFAAGALYAAELSGLTFPRTGYDGTRAWLDEVTEENYYRVGYTHKGTGKVYAQESGYTEALGSSPAPSGTPVNFQYSHHEALTAAAVLLRVRLDRNRTDSRLMAGCQLLVKDLPNWSQTEIDYVYWHFGTAAVLTYDGPAGAFGKPWNERVRSTLVPNQNGRSTGCPSGSWQPMDRWSLEGGRVYATAMNALTLESYYRYPIGVK